MSIDTNIYVYIIKGERGFYYCGITGDIYTRYLSHNLGKVSSTREFKPFVLVLLVRVANLREARIFEKVIKNVGVEVFYNKNRHRKNEIYEEFIRIREAEEKKGRTFNTSNVCAN